MALKIAIQMDPITGVDVDADTSFDFALEAYSRGHEVSVYSPLTVSLDGDRVIARTQKATRLERSPGDHVDLDAPALTELSSFDAILVRQDPPFDMAYITSVQLLERLPTKTQVLNDPRSIRDAPEKLFVTEFQDLTPPTLISRDTETIHSFRDTHGDVIVKPLYGNGGADVFKMVEDDPNFNTLLELFTDRFREPFIVQKFLPSVSAGDKRIILLDGEAVGAINRVPAKGEARSNMHVGGRAEPIEMSARDQEICDRIGPALSERGLIFVGIDIIGDYLTEINVTSPTGVQEVRRFGGADISALFIDWIEGNVENGGPGS
ncbi:MAG: glutathione synthase [Pseudomonadota bacterium]